MILDIEYTVIATQRINWPDDEADNLDYDNLMVQLEPENATLSVEDILTVEKDGENIDL